MSRISLVKLLSTLVLTLGTLQLSASTITYAVGTCKPSLPTYLTISAALAATPAPNVVMVCPGTYNEQVEITQAVTLEGVSDNDSAQAIIAPPAGGLLTNASFGSSGVAAQIWVNNASGPVNIKGLIVDGAGNGITSFPPFIAGVFYQNSSGTVSHIVARNQSGNRAGMGVLLDGGASSPSVTVQQSSFHSIDFIGINVAVSSGPLNATIQQNDVDGGGVAAGIDSFGAAFTVSGNRVTNTNGGLIANPGTTGSVSNNVVIGGGPSGGIFVDADGVSVKGNQIFNSNSKGIWIYGTSVATVQGNTIVNSLLGIDFRCNADGNVSSNTITDAGTALSNVPASLSTTNVYFNVGTIRSSGSC
jgi:parallel beta-helix repeat protein